MLESTFSVQFAGLMDWLCERFSRQDLCLRAEHYLRGLLSQVEETQLWVRNQRAAVLDLLLKICSICYEGFNARRARRPFDEHKTKKASFSGADSEEAS